MGVPMRETIGEERPTLKLLEHCEKGDLVLGEFLGEIVWAIVCYRGNEFLYVVSLTGKKAPYAFNAYHRGQPMLVTCLNFGKRFRLVPDYFTPSELIAAGGASVKVGNLMLTEKHGLVLVADFPGQTTIKFVPLGSYELMGEPGGLLATFQRWSLWLDDLEGYPSPTKVLDHLSKPEIVNE
jgi:hypothetical protein